MKKNTKHMLPQLPILGGLAAFALLLVLPATTQAQAPPKELFACYVPSSGVVYRIKESGVKDECTGKKHVEFSWVDGAGAVQGGDAAGGDLDGTYPNPTVDGLQGNAVSPTDPGDGQVLAWDATASEYQPTSVNGAASSPWAGYEVVSNKCAFSLQCIAVCPAGKIAIGGGFGGAPSPGTLRRNLPSLPQVGLFAWEVEVFPHGNLIARAICVNGP